MGSMSFAGQWKPKPDSDHTEAEEGPVQPGLLSSEGSVCDFQDVEGQAIIWEFEKEDCWPWLWEFWAIE